MHPLAISLDASLHSHKHAKRVKRRSSLDNSCLSAHESLRLMLDDNEDFERAMPRRFSLNNKLRITATFMAELKPSCHIKDDLDLDYHHSNHGPSGNHCRKQVAALEPQSVDETEFSIDDFSDDSNLSDCDSFCDASVQEPANKEYLQKDLGASCFWEMSFSDRDDCEDEGGDAFGQNNMGNLHMSGDLSEGGHIDEPLLQQDGLSPLPSVSVLASSTGRRFKRLSKKIPGH
jgi:hypothetical protein